MKDKYKGPVIRGVAFVAILAAVVAACSGGNDGGSIFGVVSKVEDNFGTAFGAQFRAIADSEPADPAAADIVAISLTTEPVDIP